MCFWILGLLAFVSSLFSQQEVVLVTGASRGIGKAVAELLEQEGYIVYAGVRALPSESASGRLRWILLDVTDEGSVDAAVRRILAEEGRIDALVNNAGVIVSGSVENVSIDEARAVFDVNYFGAMRMMQAVLPSMRERNKGRIIQISSRSGFRPLPSLGVYAASKFALEGLSEATAALVKPWNVKISLIEPGPVDTDLGNASPYGSRLALEQDPYRPLFENAGLLDASVLRFQSAQEIALFVKEAIQSETPLFRYQTTRDIREQAARRMVDISGVSCVDEWDPILFPKKGQ